jgi:N,N'-diacetyllegionaminate synthase
MMRVGSKDIDTTALIVAEIGNNHEGDPALAEEMIGLAAESGADAVKLQAIDPSLLVSPLQQERLQQLERFSLSHSDFERLASVAAQEGVEFLLTPFSSGGVDLVARLCPAVKVASGDNDHHLLLREVAATGLPILLSTGMSDLEGVMTTVRTIETTWQGADQRPGLVLLHCVSAYPTPYAEANLAAIRTLAGLGHRVGYSDHTLGIEAAVSSVALGARVIEKHFTDRRDRSDFRDHQLSSDPQEFRELVARVRNVEALIGDGKKRLMPSEKVVASAARRSLHAAGALPAGHVITATDLIALRPSGGIPASNADEVIGRRTTAALEALQVLRFVDFE